MMVERPIEVDPLWGLSVLSTHVSIHLWDLYRSHYSFFNPRWG